MFPSIGPAIPCNQPARRYRLLALLVTSLWVVGVGVGLYWLGKYEATPGFDTQPQSHLPPSFPITLDPHRPTIVMLAHPRCPCTRASFAELAKLLARHPDLSAHVFFFTPGDGGPDWSQSDLRGTAKAIPRLTTHDDIDGQAAHIVGASTSGTVLVVAPDRSILFRGGLTSGRGHQGDNPSTQAITHALEPNTTDLSLTPTYGCAIFASDNCGQCKEGNE